MGTPWPTNSVNTWINTIKRFVCFKTSRLWQKYLGQTTR